MPFKRPPIPERFSSAMPSSRQESLRSKLRQVSHSSQISATSSTSEFIEHKLLNIGAEIDYLNTYKHGVLELYEHPEMEKDEVYKELESIEKRVLPLEREFVVVKRQKKIVEEDLAEETSLHETMEDAYASIMVSKVMLATGKQKKRRFGQSKFKKDVLSYYNASRTENGYEETYCHLLHTWLPAKTVESAHLVPKSLQSEELSYLFGVGEAVLSDPRNGIPLFSVIENALDDGTIAIVPIPPTATTETTKWRCVLIDTSLRNRMVSPGVRWNDLDWKELKFLGDNRPARRYLYFRFLMTYLHHKKNRNVAWAEKVEAKGKMWATPGPYLRRSMIIILAKKASDYFLPETFWEETTFMESSGSASKSAEEEEVLATALSIRMKDEAEEKAENEDESESDSEND